VHSVTYTTTLAAVVRVHGIRANAATARVRGHHHQAVSTLPAQWFPRHQKHLRYCIAFACRVKDYQISGPAWLGDLKFDILAKASANTRPFSLSSCSRRFSIAKPKRFRGSRWWQQKAGSSERVLTRQGRSPARRAENQPGSAIYTDARSGKNPASVQTGVTGKYDIDFSRDDV
jgi:hypothetical protein